MVKSRWTHHHKLSNTVHFWHVTSSVPTLHTRTQSWGKFERTFPGLERGSTRVQGSLQDNWTTLGRFPVCSCPDAFSLLSTQSCRSSLLFQGPRMFLKDKGKFASVQMTSRHQHTICNVWDLMTDLKNALLYEGLSSYYSPTPCSEFKCGFTQRIC